ncbi:hypothetical protein CHS0354_016962 [Potamilus streckersoni]|uniref:TRIM56 n=1 Tax=Potamilus streckersoni TaxID=2493646 RepID=A0AAE0VRT8_9BIVA|nr:hypothetical protein CHS0354_016962 [Potamilus streckersoni]
MAVASQTETRLSQILECPICLETLKRPKVLPCGHTYCAACLQSHISNKVTHGGTPQARFPCPVCRVETASSDPNIRVEQWAESLPVNSVVYSLIDFSERNEAGKYCGQCQNQGKESLAICLCKECGQAMCMTCKQYHNGFPSLSQHDIINLIDGDESCSVIPNQATIEVCSSHSSERIKFFCGDHNRLCCNTCVILEHRKCDRVTTVDDMITSSDVKTKLINVETTLSKSKEHLQQIMRRIETSYGTIQKDKADILQHIHSLKAQLIAKLENLEHDVIASLEGNCKSENINLQTLETKGQSLVTAIDNDKVQLKLVMANGSEVQKIIMLHNIDQNQHSYNKAISEFETKISEVRISFDVDETFQTFVNDIDEIGKIHLIHSNLDCSSCHELLTASISGPIRFSLNESEAVKVSEFNVKISGDTNLCSISDILHLKDTRILLVDSLNYTIKMFEQNYEFLESLKLQEYPCSACSLSNTEVAVTIPVQKTIQIIGTKDKMLKIRKIRTRLQCWGIVVVKNQLMIATHEDENSVLILDMHGKEIRTVRSDRYQIDKCLKPLFIKTDMTKATIFISYDHGLRFIAYNMNWNVLFTISNQDLASATGIDTDREGNIYLCEYVSQCVQQISPEGKLIKTLISKTEESKSPLAISFYRDKDRFILTYGDCDVVEVYDLRV